MIFDNSWLKTISETAKLIMIRTSFQDTHLVIFDYTGFLGEPRLDFIFIIRQNFWRIELILAKDSQIHLSIWWRQIASFGDLHEEFQGIDSEIIHRRKNLGQSFPRRIQKIFQKKDPKDFLFQRFQNWKTHFSVKLIFKKKFTYSCSILAFSCRFVCFRV